MVDRDKDQDVIDSMEGGIIRYEVGGQKVLLTTQIVRRFFLSDADDLEAASFGAFCRANQLDPFRKEAYLVRYKTGEKASVIVAWDSYLKRAEGHPKYRGFRAGIVVVRTDQGALDLSEHGEPDIVTPPFVAIEGQIIPPGHELIGGWCKVYRRDRDQPIKATVDFNEYVKRDREGNPTRFWREMPANQIRVRAISKGVHDAFPDAYAGWYSEDEAPDKTPAEREVERPAEPVVPTIPAELLPLMEALGWNKANRQMWYARRTGRKIDELEAELRAEITAKQRPAIAATSSAGGVPVSEIVMPTEREPEPARREETPTSEEEPSLAELLMEGQETRAAEQRQARSAAPQRDAKENGTPKKPKPAQSRFTAF